MGFGLKGFWGFRNDFEGDIEIAELCVLLLFFSDPGQERERKGRRERGLGFCNRGGFLNLSVFFPESTYG